MNVRTWTRDPVRQAGERAFAHDPVQDASDLALLHRARAGEAPAAEELLDRHGPAVRELADELGPQAYDRSYDAVRTRLARGEHPGLPVRAAWLAELAGTSLALDAPQQHRPVWSAYLDLPDAWQVVLWHHAVEGETAREIGAHLGLGEPEVARAASSARVALRQATAARHTAGDAPACQELLLSLRHGSPMRLDRKARCALREHGRRCDDCMPLVRDVFLLELSLRETLAEAVLGEHATAYLGARPGPRRLPAPRRRSAGGVVGSVVGSAAARRLRPVVATVGAGAVGAAAAGVMLVGPYSLPSGDDDRVVAGGSAPGSVLAPVRGDSVGRAGVRSADAAETALRTTLRVGAPEAPGGSGGPDGNGSPAADGGPGTPVSDGPTGEGPAAPPGAGAPPVGDGSPSTPGAPVEPGGPSSPVPPPVQEPAPVVEVDVSQGDDGSVGVGVKTPITGPVEVKTPPLPGGSSGPVGQAVGGVVGAVDGVVGGVTGAVGGVLGGALGGGKVDGSPVNGGGLLP